MEGLKDSPKARLMHPNPPQAAWLLPGWLPLPSFRARDRAHQKMKQIFQEIIDERRRTGNTTSQNDMIATYMNNPYRNVCIFADCPQCVLHLAEADSLERGIFSTHCSRNDPKPARCLHVGRTCGRMHRLLLLTYIVFIWLVQGVYMTDDQIAGMCIAILLAGQHTSSTTGSWLGFYLCVQPDLQYVSLPSCYMHS